MLPDAEIANMKSRNFEFLRARREVLADLAGFAERYAHEDPASSLIKERSFVEHAVAAIHERCHVLLPRAQFERRWRSTLRSTVHLNAQTIRPRCEGRVLSVHQHRAADEQQGVGT